MIVKAVEYSNSTPCPSHRNCLSKKTRCPLYLPTAKRSNLKVGHPAQSLATAKEPAPLVCGAGSLKGVFPLVHRAIFGPLSGHS